MSKQMCDSVITAGDNGGKRIHMSLFFHSKRWSVKMAFKIFKNFFGYCVQWLDVGSQFPDQELNLGYNSESAESWPLALQGTLLMQI